MKRWALERIIGGDNHWLYLGLVCGVLFLGELYKNGIRWTWGVAFGFPRLSIALVERRILSFLYVLQ